MEKLVGVMLLALVCCGDREAGTSGGGGSSQGGQGASAECDADHDGEDSIECGGRDCCDQDDGVPSLGFHSTEHACGGFDWNCDGSAESEFDELFDCEFTDINVCGAANPGWSSDTDQPLCGESAGWSTECTHDMAAAMCVAVETEQRTQRCR